MRPAKASGRVDAAGRRAGASPPTRSSTTWTAAGELYLAYRFDHLDVFEYKAADASLGTILVELYSMKTPDDAFGLLSNDWGGEVAAFEQGPPPTAASAAVPQHRALYGAGLLRIWNRQPLRQDPRVARDAGVARCGPDARTGITVTDERPTAADAVHRRRLRRSCRAGDLSPCREGRLDSRPRSHLLLPLAPRAELRVLPRVAGHPRPRPRRRGGDDRVRPAAGPGERPLRVILIRYPSAERARRRTSDLRGRIPAGDVGTAGGRRRRRSATSSTAGSAGRRRRQDLRHRARRRQRRSVARDAARRPVLRRYRHHPGSDRR